MPRLAFYLLCRRYNPGHGGATQSRESTSATDSPARVDQRLGKWPVRDRRGLRVRLAPVVDGSGGRRPPPMLPDQWLAGVIDRHTSAFSRPEFLKAVRALSARYVETRARLPSRSPLDTAGKRAAFAGFYAPLHYLTIESIIRALGPVKSLSRVVDLGCGTGVAAAAWASCLPKGPVLVGVDQNAWALDEMRWNCRALGLRCRTQRTSMLSWLQAELSGGSGAPLRESGIVCAWSLNELSTDDRGRTLDNLLAAHERQASVLIVEPLASSAVPWWNDWRERIVGRGGRVDEWRLPLHLPSSLSEMDEAAGFRREALTARSFWLGGQ